MIKTKSLTNNYNIETFLFCSLILILSFIELEIRSKSLIFIILLIFFYNYKNKDKYKFGFTFKFNKISYLIIIFIALIINQNTYLNFEIISIDVPSYLVASRSINFLNFHFLINGNPKALCLFTFIDFYCLYQTTIIFFFRILNDLLLFLITFLIFSTSYKISNNYFTAFISSIFFVSITSHVWYVTELSEIYCLVFILYQYFIISGRPMTKKTILLCGVLVSISSLINQSTAIFLIGCIFYIYKEINLKELNYYFTLLLGFLIPQIIFYLLYFFNDLSILYFTNYIKIPFGYVGSGEFQLYELIVWLRRYFNFSQLLYFSFLSVFFVLAIKLLKKQFFKSFRFNLNILYLILGFLIYVIAGHNYQHHLFYTIAFFSILISHLEINKMTSVIYVLIIFSAIHIFSFSFDKSFNNLINYEETFDNYPLRSLASEINNLYEDKNYEVLAIDHVLLLFYLEKPNISYIIHPFNNFEEYIVNALLETGKLKTNDSSHLSYYIETEPEIIICAPQTIIDGSPTKLGSDIFNCEITDYKKNYIKLDTQIYLDNPNREYYYNPYISIDVFIKTKDSS